MTVERLLFLEAYRFFGSTGFRPTITAVLAQFIERWWTESGSGSIIFCAFRELWWWKRGTECLVCFCPFERRAQQTRACFSICLVPEELLFVVDGGLTFDWEFQTGVATQPCKEQPHLHKAALCCAGCCTWPPPRSLQPSSVKASRWKRLPSLLLSFPS